MIFQSILSLLIIILSIIYPHSIGSVYNNSLSIDISMNEQPQNQNWMPLQSNPQVINPFIQKMGMVTSSFAFQELISTQEWALEMIPQPALGILFLYEETPAQQQYKQQEALNLAPQIPNNVFFMRQYARNACGTIALFHIVLNALDQHPDLITTGSYLDNFRLNAANLDPQARGQLFKENKQILEQHKQAVQQGQSSVQNECDSHFIAFVVKNGRLVQLDGIKSSIVDHGPCQQEQLLTKGSGVIKQFMQRDPQNINFSMIVLAALQAE